MRNIVFAALVTSAIIALDLGAAEAFPRFWPAVTFYYIPY
jgi:hypothetical protein